MAHHVARQGPIEGRRSPSYILQRSHELKKDEEETFELNDGTGLSSERAARLLTEHGPNELPKRTGLWLSWREILCAYAPAHDLGSNHYISGD